MISFIKGVLIEKDPTALLIDVNGIGYEVFVPMTTFYTLGDIDSQVSLYTHFIVREDAQQLYGFKSKVDKKVFQELIKVNGIGARTAIAILSGMDSKTLLHCIENKDYALLATVPGIGKKTAERLVVEIYDKLLKMANEIYAQTSGTTTTSQDSQAQQAPTSVVLANSIFNESVDALLALGYKQKDAEKMARSAMGDATTAAEVIRKALQGSIKSKR
ncbi:Holliday junction branch migration protein RuvA [Francisella tularensis]|uniref:Holliday junction branch migration complex subunit RuvA n=1 Tax=Francisella tularensis subsp. tularensis (strain WY96-3418) TaxID=418136 RepID=RUVA_FRATW|nr:Holliday junction branch migration protein RuvA [Francisella tularensis]A4IY85.1 RecName: Full=Holliday junction branch migration complex subunit RuvA [Francisella tularensis subsp. tularensis WY96-3418]ABO46886.1 holliday junction DNA helicase RuvA [Francisella tularensis subsp. tularensis WY96-3418]AJI63585.1 Holliday junction DNA helicase RuvA [Francisella tularensis subsp. tularensis]AKH92145.1 ATP-dependent DNA helicase RuvA [Francisella tularensis subsp. tularensis WY-00W4114]AKU74273